MHDPGPSVLNLHVRLGSQDGEGKFVWLWSKKRKKKLKRRRGYKGHQGAWNAISRESREKNRKKISAGAGTKKRGDLLDMPLQGRS